MRYMLLLHSREEDVHTASPDSVEDATAFLARFEDELVSRSELDWSEVLGSEVHAEVIDPGGRVRSGWCNPDGLPLARLWAIRVADPERARELAAQLAAATNYAVELRECMPTAQRP